MTVYLIFLLVTSAIGLTVLIWWLATTEMGLKSLAPAVERPNFMPDYFPFAVILGWFLMTATSSSVFENLASGMLEWHEKFALYSSFILIEAAVIGFIILSAKKYFRDGLYGFGLRLKGIFQDIAAGAVGFITAYPLVNFSLYAVYYIGIFFVGPTFELDKNQGMVVILEYDEIALRILTIFFAVVLTPVFEELVFRGLLQTYLRNLNYSPWVSIFITSAIFAILHPLTHFPAIFILSVTMGYAYEKSGSLLRPMFIHCFFNSTAIITALLTGGAT